jgi:hypothetical protein
VRGTRQSDDGAVTGPATHDQLLAALRDLDGLVEKGRAALLSAVREHLAGTAQPS